MTEDRDAIDRETNVAIELTDRGIKAGTNSRVLAALDLWFGRKLHGWATRADRQARTEAAKTEVQVNLIKAAGAIAIDKLGSDPDLVREVLAEQLGHLRDNSRKQENKKAVLIEALDELESTEPNATPGQSGDAAGEIDEDMLNYL